jgi:haloacetate dehalogenase
MTAASHLFPGFGSVQIQTSTGRIFARTGGKGPPLLLLHGFPQTHAMWHQIAPALAERFSVVVADLPGYGASDVPETDENHTPYTKRAMAQAMLETMEALGHRQFSLAGHDRGGRVAYRLGLDHPDRLTRMVVLDILPTYDYWANLNRLSALRIYHWTFLAQPYPLPETLISRDSDAFFGPAFAQGFDPRAVDQYLSALRDPLRVHGLCEDYRAGAYADYDHDKADLEAGKKITTPTHVIWGTRGIAAAGANPLETWAKWATQLTGEAVEAGHFLCEENPNAVQSSMLSFLLSMGG